MKSLKSIALKKAIMMNFGKRLLAGIALSLILIGQKSNINGISKGYH